VDEGGDRQRKRERERERERKRGWPVRSATSGEARVCTWIPFVAIILFTNYFICPRSVFQLERHTSKPLPFSRVAVLVVVVVSPRDVALAREGGGGGGRGRGRGQRPCSNCITET